mgnify:CR=1 FL=1
MTKIISGEHRPGPRVKHGATNQNSHRICEPIHGATNKNRSAHKLNDKRAYPGDLIRIVVPDLIRDPQHCSLQTI